jgi:hypothetical protein
MPKLWLSSQLRTLAPEFHDRRIEGASALTVMMQISAAAPAFGDAIFPGGGEEPAPFVAIFVEDRQLLPDEFRQNLISDGDRMRIIFGMAGG